MKCGHALMCQQPGRAGAPTPHPRSQLGAWAGAERATTWLPVPARCPDRSGTDGAVRQLRAGGAAGQRRHRALHHMALHTRRRRPQPPVPAPALRGSLRMAALLSRVWAASRVCTLLPARGWLALPRAALDRWPRALWQGCLIRLPMRRAPSLIRLRMQQGLPGLMGQLQWPRTLGGAAGPCAGSCQASWGTSPSFDRLRVKWLWLCMRAQHS